MINLIERLRAAADNKALDIGTAWSLLAEAADALAAPAADAEPVAEVLSRRFGNGTSTLDVALEPGTKVYTRPPAAVPDSRDCGCAHYWNCPSLRQQGEKPTLRLAAAPAAPEVKS